MTDNSSGSRLLGDSDTIEIFKKCKRRIRNRDKQVLQNLSRKKYYRSLKLLKEYGLVAKDTDTLTHMFTKKFGSHVFTNVSMVM